MIYVNIPYAVNGNLGEAYNQFMRILPNEDDWACFIDHDAMVTTSGWFKQISKIVEENPEVGAFTCRTNRVGHKHQLIRGVNIDNHHVGYHRAVGEAVAKKFHTSTDPIGGHRTHEQIEFTNVGRVEKGQDRVYYDWGFSGVFILVKKSTWRQIRGFQDGFLEVDMAFSTDVHKHNIPFHIMNGVYVYHWYRASDPYTRTASTMDSVREDFRNEKLGLDNLTLY